MNLHHLSVSSDATWQRYAAPINTQCTLSHGEENVQCSSYTYTVRVTVSVDVGDFEIEIPGCLFCRPDRNKSGNDLLMYTMDYNCALSGPDSLKLLYISSPYLYLIHFTISSLHQIDQTLKCLEILFTLLLVHKTIAHIAYIVIALSSLGCPTYMYVRILLIIISKSENHHALTGIVLSSFSDPQS